MKAREWEALRRTSEAVELRSAAVAWVTRNGGEAATDARLMDAAIAFATLVSRVSVPANVGGRARKLLAELTTEVARFEGFELLFNDAIRERDALRAAAKTPKRRVRS